MMATQSQIEANRRNAKKSTGPKTAAGKATVARNAVKHGLLSQEVLLSDEDPGALEELTEELRRSWYPVGAAEELLVDKIVALVWRTRRLVSVETGLFEYRLQEAARSRASADARRHKKYKYLDDPDELLKGMTIFKNKAAHDAAMAEADAAETRRDGAMPTLGRAFAEDERVFAGLCRYQTTLDRQLVRAYHDLERLQRMRAGQEIAPPVTLDVDVHVAGGSEHGS